MDASEICHKSLAESCSVRHRDLPQRHHQRLHQRQTRLGSHCALLPSQDALIWHASIWHASMAYQLFVDLSVFTTTGLAVSVDTLSTFHFRTKVRFWLSTGSAYHFVSISPESLIHTRRLPQRSKPVLVMLELTLEVKPAAENAPSVLSIKSVGDVQLPVLTIDEFVGSAVKDPSLAFCVTTEF